jgi:hypothetical protein
MGGMPPGPSGPEGLGEGAPATPTGAGGLVGGAPDAPEGAGATGLGADCITGFAAPDAAGLGGRLTGAGWLGAPGRTDGTEGGRFWGTEGGRF